jgi:hypothetical protein
LNNLSSTYCCEETENMVEVIRRFAEKNNEERNREEKQWVSE